MRKVALIAVFCAFVAAPVSADMTYTTVDGVTMGFGNVVEGNSWSFQVFAGGPVWNLGAGKISSAGDVYKSPAAADFSNAGWGILLDQPTLSSWSGPTTSNINWRMYFEDDLDKDVVIDWALFNGDTLVWTSRYTIVNGELAGYEPRSQYWVPTRSEVVPVPGAVLLGMIGLSVVGVKLRKRA